MITKEEIKNYCTKHKLSNVPVCAHCGNTTLKLNKTGKIISPSLIKNTCSRTCSKQLSISTERKSIVAKAKLYLDANNLEYIDDAISIYAYTNNIKEYPRCECCNSIDMFVYKKLITNDLVVSKTKKYCSNKCSTISTGTERLTKRIETNNNRYGVDNPMQTLEIQNKVKDTNIKKYGVSNPMQNVEVSAKSSSKRKDLYDSDSYKNKIQDTLLRHTEQQKKTWNDILIDKNMSVVEYSNSKKPIVLECSKCGSKSEWSVSHLHKLKEMDYSPCKKCNSDKFGGGKLSKIHQKVVSFLKLNNINFIENTFILGNREIDILLVDYNIGLEINGLYWHSAERKGKSYHQDKTKLAKEKGIAIIHLWEDDINFKFEIICSMILNKINKSSKIFARKTTIKIVNNKIANAFLETNHLQGSCNSKTKLGLFYNNELVSLMTFGKSRFEKDSIELIRFCNKLNTTVVGGASKLFKFYMKGNNRDVTSFSNSDFSTGNLYEQLGFTYIKDTPPTLFWVKNGFRESRFKFQKHKLELSENEIGLTGHEILISRGYHSICDAGNKKYIYYVKN
jgi:very-short-patch-repair endonuclease